MCVSYLVASDDPRIVTEIEETLRSFGEPALRFAARAGIRIVPLAAGERYTGVSSALRRLGIEIDDWPAPPAGLFVVEERTMYLRSFSRMTVAHEFGHALDCALGGGVYRSGVDPRIRRAYARARTFVTPYAASGIDEYFAESVRAYVGVNDASSLWPPATRARLLAIDPPIAHLIDEIFRREIR
ncbi:MAG TPA: hypothetical protein VN905_08045 [Candidatus Binatia bacterium]|nr:hypothetical protein [Candidatus Binatia bacterium]